MPSSRLADAVLSMPTDATNVSPVKLRVISSSSELDGLRTCASSVPALNLPLTSISPASAAITSDGAFVASPERSATAGMTRSTVSGDWMSNSGDAGKAITKRVPFCGSPSHSSGRLMLCHDNVGCTTAPQPFPRACSCCERNAPKSTAASAVSRETASLHESSARMMCNEALSCRKSASVSMVFVIPPVSSMKSTG